MRGGSLHPCGRPLMSHRSRRYRICEVAVQSQFRIVVYLLAKKLKMPYHHRLPADFEADVIIAGGTSHGRRILRCC